MSDSSRSDWVCWTRFSGVKNINSGVQNKTTVLNLQLQSLYLFINYFFSVDLNVKYPNSVDSDASWNHHSAAGSMWKPDWHGVLEADLCGTRNQPTRHTGGVRHRGQWPERRLLLPGRRWALHTQGSPAGSRAQSHQQHQCQSLY